MVDRSERHTHCTSCNYFRVGYTTYMDIFFGGCFGLLLINGLIFLLAMIAKRNSRDRDQVRQFCQVSSPNSQPFVFREDGAEWPA